MVPSGRVTPAQDPIIAGALRSRVSARRPRGAAGNALRAREDDDTGILRRMTDAVRSSSSGGIRTTAVTLALLAGSLSAVGAITSGPALCPMALLTGTACPGCGMTRAVVALVQGDVRSSWDAHPFAAVVVGATLVFLGQWGAALRGRVPRLSTRQAAVAGAVTGVALIVVWSVRYASGTLPAV